MKKFLEELNQQHIYKTYEKLFSDKKKKLKAQISSFNKRDLKKQFSLFFKIKKKEQYIPLKKGEHYSLKYEKLGEESLKNKEIATLVMAGGMATRLKSNKPKGFFPITLVKKKSLFQLMCEKLLAAEKKYQTKLFLIIMTSKANHDETITFFKKNKFFGVKKRQIDFFFQDELPFLDDQGKWTLEKKDKITSAPDGNGAALEKLKESSIFQKLKNKKIKYLTIVPIDNPLADPFDKILIGFHKKKRSDISLVVIENKPSCTKMGGIVKNNNKIKVIEYIDFEKANSSTIFKYLNTSIFCVSLDFIIRNKFDLPLHFVKKKVKNNFKKTKKFWKSEKFIFDILDYTNKTNIICYPQKICYSPLKNFSGIHSVKAVQRALYERDRRIFSDISKKSVYNKIFELSPDFYYPDKKLLKKWKNKNISKANYIE